VTPGEFPPAWLSERCTVFRQRTAAMAQRVWGAAAPVSSRGLRVVKDTGKTTIERLRAMPWQTLARRYLPLLTILSALLLLFGFWKLPQWYAASWDKLDPKDIAKLESDTRTAMVQALGGIALLTGLLFTWRNLRLTEQTSRHTLDLSRKGQINDRFIKAIEQLGAIDQDGGKKLEVRLGGIYALEQIAKDSPDDHHWPVMEILTAYVRENAPWQEEEQPSIEETSPSETQPTPSNQLRPKLALDIQAILTVLGRRARTYSKGEDQRLNLARTNLQGVQLRGAHLERADFAHAHLEAAVLWDAHLEGAHFDHAHLEGATNLTVEQLATVRTLYGAHLDSLLLEQIRQQHPQLLERSLLARDLSRAKRENS
jgi:hypothetical protein